MCSRIFGTLPLTGSLLKFQDQARLGWNQEVISSGLLRLKERIITHILGDADLVHRDKQTRTNFIAN